MELDLPMQASGFPHARRPAFTLIELLVVVAIIGLLVSILLPALSSARQQTKALICLTNMRALGQGMAIYTNEYNEVFVPGRLPNIDNYNASALIFNQLKYRPTFLALMAPAVGLPPFEDPMPSKLEYDRFGERGDRQNYGPNLYVCASTPSWRDERNGSYGYNYQFLGNSRLRDESDLTSYKNWPVRVTNVTGPARTVMFGDCMGTAASYVPAERRPYEDDARDADRYGNEGFNLDPPRIDWNQGEAAGFENVHRTAVDPRHRGRGNILWADSHGAPSTLADLGYEVLEDGTISGDGENTLWSTDGRDVSWTPEYRPGRT